MTTIRLLTASAALLALAACQSPTAQPTSAAATPTEVNFVTNAYQVIRFDQEEGNLARTQARDPEVKALAAKLLDESNQFEAQLKPLADEIGIRPPNVLREDLRVRLGHMRLERGLDFDRTYLDDQIASHEESQRNEEGMMVQSTNPRFKELAQRGMSLVQTNLASLRALREQMGPMGGARRRGLTR